MVEFLYVSYIFDSLLVGFKLNHAVMEQDFQRCTITKFLSCTLGYAYLFDVETSGGYHAKIRVCIFVREEHWDANQNHA
jgi:hypothetical protein